VERRDFLRIAGLSAASGYLAGQQTQSILGPSAAPDVAKTDFTLRIAPVTVELSLSRIISTIGYNGTSPGPLLRMKENVPVTVNVMNDTDVPEFVHFHGLLIPSDVDGAEEEGTPPVPPHGSRRYQFTPTPAGTRWYHTHTMSMDDLHRGSYTGMFGFLIVEGGGNPGNYDQEHYLALRDWEPYFSNQAMDNDDLDNPGPQPEKPAVMDTRPPGPEVIADIYSINGKMLGSGEPIRVKQGERVMFHFLNASAIEIRHLALPSHKFNVIASDGNPVPTPAAVDVLMIGPGERVDAWVEMNHPGVWILGDLADDDRRHGMGIVVEYAGAKGTPQWVAAPAFKWNYTRFSKPGAAATPPDEAIVMTFAKDNAAHEGFNLWTVNGVAFPMSENVVPASFHLKEGKRYRVRMRNASDDIHPIHLHRHSFEVTGLAGKATAGILKDVLMLGGYQEAEIDFVADNPGRTLFHCHQQLHMDFGFMTLFDYL